MNRARRRRETGMDRWQFTGHIAGAGTTGGTRLVLGAWDHSPLGPFADVMVAHPDGRRELLAPDDWVADFVSATYVFGIWGGIAVASGLAALAGYLLLDGAAPATLAFVNALAAGAILAMITDTMIPEAFEDAALYSGLIAAAGFLAAFGLHAAGGG